jgi:hypothetical protein
LPALSKLTTSEDVVCKELSYDLIELFKCSKFLRFDPGLSFIPESLLLPFNLECSSLEPCRDAPGLAKLPSSSVEYS